MAGRPLTGSVSQLPSGMWEASLPYQRGSRRRVRAVFASRTAADAWIATGIADIGAGRPVTAPATTAVDTSHWLVDVVDAWFDSKYRRAQRSGPTRANAVRGHLDNHILPFFTSRWSKPSDVHLDDCEVFMLNLAGRCTADGRSVMGTDEELPAVTQEYAGEIKRTLRAALAHALARQIITHNPATVIEASDPLGTAIMRASPSGRGKVMLTFLEVHRIARGLHPVHQLVLWMQRILGLRIAEVYGIEIGDIVRDGEYGVAVIASQGGRTFHRWTANGGIETCTSVDNTKNVQSDRFVVVPPMLMRLIDGFIAAFHTAADGSVDPNARLIPAMKHAAEGGIEGYTAALKLAAGHEIDQDSVCSHDLRRGLCTDLKWFSTVSEFIQRRLVGHAAGPDVHDRCYVLDHPDHAALREAADETERLLLAEVNDIMVPTCRFPLFHQTNTLHAHAAEIRSRCLDLGWLTLDDDESLSVALCADRIGRSETQARRLIQHEMIRGRKVTGPSGTEWRVDRTDVDAFLERYRDVMTLDEAAEELALSYHAAFNLQRKMQLDVRVDDVTRRLLIEQRHLDAMRAELERVQALHRRSMSVTNAATVLGRRDTTVRGWIGTHLAADPETDSSGIRFVTRESVADCQQHLADQQRQGSRSLPGRTRLGNAQSAVGTGKASAVTAS
jgi:hypothetical protein